MVLRGVVAGRGGDWVGEGEVRGEGVGGGLYWILIGRLIRRGLSL